MEAVGLTPSKRAVAPRPRARAAVVLQPEPAHLAAAKKSGGASVDCTYQLFSAVDTRKVAAEGHRAAAMAVEAIVGPHTLPGASSRPPPACAFTFCPAACADACIC